MEERSAPLGFSDPAARDDGEHQQHETDDGNFHDLARAQEAQVDAHEQRDRDGQANRVETPCGLAQCVHDDEREDRDDDRHDEHGRDDRCRTSEATQLLAGHLAQRNRAGTHREEQYEVVLNRAGKNHTDDDPNRARQVTHLGRQNRANQRASARDRSEVVAIQDATVSRHVVLAVILHFRRCCSTVIRLSDLTLDVLCIEAVRDQVGTDGRENQPYRVDRFAAAERDSAPTDSTQKSNADPHDDAGWRPFTFLSF